jgi:hypothetical protein
MQSAELLHDVQSQPARWYTYKLALYEPEVYLCYEF